MSEYYLTEKYWQNDYDQSLKFTSHQESRVPELNQEDTIPNWKTPQICLFASLISLVILKIPVMSKGMQAQQSFLKTAYATI
jgi:hypothetical protein